MQHPPDVPLALRTNSKVLAEARKVSGHPTPAPSPTPSQASGPELNDAAERAFAPLPAGPGCLHDLSPAGHRDQDRLPGRALELSFWRRRSGSALEARGKHGKHGDSGPPHCRARQP